MRDRWRDRRSERGVRVTQGRKRPSEKKLTGGWVWRSETHGCFQGGQSGACLYHQQPSRGFFLLGALLLPLC